MNKHKFSIQVCSNPQEIEASEADVLVIIEGLGRNILKHLGDIELGRSIRVFLRDEEGRVVGGTSANIFGGWLYIGLLWVDESLRNQGYGGELSSRMEREAMKLGCRNAHVDTYSFEARPF